ncbi:MAG: chemotaxis protein CheX [Clostridiales bacterium]|nr:chemotaxis protein CheX [Clostridiales bacterium]
MSSISIEEIADLFANNLSKVLRTMAGFEVSSIQCGQQGMPEIEPSIMGAMILHGQKDAMISLAMEDNTAYMLIAYMTGILPEDLEEQDLYDGVGELVNIMTGEVKARLANTPYQFRLTSPFALGGDNLKVVFKKNLQGACRFLTAGELEIIFRISYI